MYQIAYVRICNRRFVETLNMDNRKHIVEFTCEYIINPLKGTFEL